MKTYFIHYKDPDPACPVFRIKIEAYDRDEAIEIFFGDGDDWEIVKITRS